MVGSLSVPSVRCARGTVDGFDLQPPYLNLIVERWLCTKTLILVRVERSVQYRERSAAVAHSECRAISTVPRAQRPDGTLDITPKI